MSQSELETRPGDAVAAAAAFAAADPESSRERTLVLSLIHI